MGYGTTLYRHEATVTPYLGDTATGPTWDTDSTFTLKCRFRTKRKVIRTARGDEILADAYLYCRADESLSEKDKVTRNGRDYVIAEIVPAEGLTATNHLEVWLRAD